MPSKTLTLWGTAALLSVTASVPAAPKAATLPLTRVRLYETGVGYFERSGAVPAGDTALPVPAGHLDDALKTLVVLGGDVKVNGVAFASSVSRDMARQLAGLPKAGEAPLGFSELARSFKGASVTLATASGSFTGRLVEVLDPGQGELESCAGAVVVQTADTTAEAATKPACQKLDRSSLVLVTDTGEVRRITSSEVKSLRPTDKGARERLDAALDALSQRGAQSRRDLGVLTGTGGKVTLGYVAEAPVWRSTYRVVLDTGRARLQGWALLHNDTDEAWQSVTVDLVNGRPHSFLYPLASPRYARRELLVPEERLDSVPQLFATQVDNLWSRGEVLPDDDAGGIGGLGLSGTGWGAGGHGRAHIGLSPESDELSVGNLAALTPAEGIEAAALFRYTLPSKLSLSAHASALVPFIDSAIKVRPVAWFSKDRDAAASALHVTNDTKQTLPAGTISVFGDGGFAGESLLPRSKPNQSHLLGYGVDLDVELTRETSAASEEPRLFSFVVETLEEHYLRRRTQKLTLKNRSSSERHVYVELDVVNNACVDGATELGHDAETDKTYSVVQVASGREATQSLLLEEGLQRRHAFTMLDAGKLRGFAAAKAVSAAQRGALTRAAEQLDLAATRRNALPHRKAELEQALADVARVRENVRILGAVRAKEVEQMSARVVTLEAQISQLRNQYARLNGELEGFVAAAKRELAKL